MYTIMLVDDEIQILNSLSRIFFDTDYDIVTADSALKALELLETKEVNLIISDVRMPMMDGFEFLSIVRKRYPKVLRVVMSAYSDEQAVINALTKGVVKHYILKPWDNDALISCIEQLLATQRLLNSKELLALFNNIEEFPTIKDSYLRIQSLIRDNANMNAIADEIEKDFSVSTKLLQIVNSAFYGVRTGSVHQAVKVLGLQNLTSLILTTSVMNAARFFNIPKDVYELLWNHALLTNTILTYLYEVFLHKKLQETALSAGLLHNIGFFASAQIFRIKDVGMMNPKDSADKDLFDLEKEFMGVTHQEIGGYLLGWWDLPFPIVEAALFHHHPFEPGIVNKELVAAVHIAQHYAWEILNFRQDTPFYPQAFEALGISGEAFESRYLGEIQQKS